MLIFTAISTILVFTTGKKKVLISVINDLATDVRVQKTCAVFIEQGFEVHLIGRILKNSPPISGFNFKAERMRLLFNKGILFYFFFNLRLFFKLLLNRADVLFANDLDTLLPNFIISKIKGVPLIYDSHEVFCEVPELINNPIKKKIWEVIERITVPKLKHCLTVNKSIADLFEQKYNVHFNVLRNIPPEIKTQSFKSKSELGIDDSKFMILFQGAGINIDRGAEELVRSMKHVENAVLYIIGSGDVWQELKRLILENQLQDRIVMINKLPKSELIHFTHNADIGLSIDKPTNINYKLSLPNKVFDYIQCGVPILASRMDEIERLVNEFQIGDFIDNHDPIHIAQKINETLKSPRRKIWKENLLVAKNMLTWDKEKKTLETIIRTL